MVLFSAVAVLALFQGCFAGYQRSTVVVVDYDERCWYDGYWVYRFHEGERFVYRRWYSNRWEEVRREPVYWEKQKWERKSRNDRDDGRRYDNDREERKDNRHEEQHEQRDYRH